jgi:hypothetical protein
MADEPTALPDFARTAIKHGFRTCGCEACKRVQVAILVHEMRQYPTLQALLAAIQKPTAVYRYYDPDDILLYVGISETLAARGLRHIKASVWMDFAARSTISRYPTRTQARRAEIKAITTERPVFNREHNEGPEAEQRLADYLVSQGRADLLNAGRLTG